MNILPRARKIFFSAPTPNQEPLTDGKAWAFFRTMMREDVGTEQHKTTVVGDTVGDPFKDTSGPSLNILIKLMSMVSIVMAGLTVALA